MRNQQKLQNGGLAGKERYYYLKFFQDGNGNPHGVATVCVIPVEGFYVRGVAFCNPKDQFAKKLGRAIALGRAVKAIETHQFNDRIPKNEPVSILIGSLGWAWLSQWDITLTEHEKRLFTGK